jgi:hypothetical protein
MRINRTLRLVFALLLAVMLPLRGYAAIAHCEPDHAMHTMHAMHAAHCADAASLHSHSCSDCCCVAAAALTPSRWTLPHTPALDVSARLIWPPPALTLDRLDRPPRLPA